MASTKAILITGATGNQGGAVLRQLATRPSSSQFTLLAVTRNASSPSAKRLTERYPGVKVVQGDLNNIPSLFTSAKQALRDLKKPEDIWGVFSVQVSMGSGITADLEVKQGKGLIDQSIKEGVRHFVYASVDRGGNETSFDEETSVPHFQTKFQIEHHLLQKAGKRGESMGWTIFRPAGFMDNLVPGIQTKVFLAALRDRLPSSKPVQWISVEDIGLFSAKAFENPTAWNARAEGLAGDALTFEQLDGVFRKVTGKSVPATYGIFGTALMKGVAEVRTMITWFCTDGFGVDVKRLRGEEAGLCDFETWLRERSQWATQKR